MSDPPTFSGDQQADDQAPSESPPEAPSVFPPLPKVAGEFVGIGRDLSNLVVVHSMKVSRFHAKILFKDEKYILEDCMSSNGTFLNQERVAETAELSEGDVIEIGPLKMLFANLRLERVIETEPPEPPKSSLPPDVQAAVRTMSHVGTKVGKRLDTAQRLLAKLVSLMAKLGRLGLRVAGFFAMIGVFLLFMIVIMAASDCGPPKHPAPPAVVATPAQR